MSKFTAKDGDTYVPYYYGNASELGDYDFDAEEENPVEFSDEAQNAIQNGSNVHIWKLLNLDTEVELFVTESEYKTDYRP